MPQTSFLDAAQTDPAVWIAWHLQIKDKQGQIVPLRPNRGQQKLERLVRKQQAAGKPVRIVGLKCRQFGFTTWGMGRGYEKCIREYNTDGLVVAHDADSTDIIFDKVRTFQELYEAAPPTRFNSKKMLDWRPPVRSRLMVQTAGKVEIGRGFTPRFLHLSEFAFWGTHADGNFLSCMQGVPDGPNTMVFVESTANGYGGAFYELYQEAKNNPDSEWDAFFFAWHEEPTYRRAVPEDFKRTNESSSKRDLARFANEEDLAKAYDLDDEQLAWRRATIVDKCKSNLDKFRQEYPGNDVEAFLMSGRPAFDIQALREILDESEAFYREHEVKRGRLVETDEKDFRQEKKVKFVEGIGPLEVFNMPHPRGQYAMGTDVAEGHGGDPSGTVVMHKRTLVDVACLHGQFTPPELAVETDKLRRFYGNACCCFDAGGVGQAFMVEYKRLTSRMYFQMVKDLLSDKRRKQLGYKISGGGGQGSRSILVSQYDKALTAREIHPRARDAIKEHFTFVFKEGGKPEHAEGCNDDHVFKRMLCLEMIMQEPYSRPRRAQTNRRGTGASVPGVNKNADRSSQRRGAN